MTIDEAIAHAREVASVQKDKCEKCAADHEQLAEWLEELKELRQGKADVIDERASLLAYICKKYNIPLLDMNCTADEWEELKKHLRSRENE